jgi:hypothetical protein
MPTVIQFYTSFRSVVSLLTQQQQGFLPDSSENIITKIEIRTQYLPNTNLHRYPTRHTFLVSLSSYSRGSRPKFPY